MQLNGNISVLKSLTKRGEWNTDRGVIVYKDDEVMISAKGSPQWTTDFATIFKFITWITFFFIKPVDRNTFRGALLHDLLWYSRVELKGMYSMEWTNKILDNCLKHDGASDMKRWIIRKGVNSSIAKKRWENPSEEVQDFKGNALVITFKESTK